MTKTVFRITKVAANQPELDEYVDARDLDLLYESLDMFRHYILSRVPLDQRQDKLDTVANLQHLLYRLGD